MSGFVPLLRAGYGVEVVLLLASFATRRHSIARINRWTGRTRTRPRRRQRQEAAPLDAASESDARIAMGGLQSRVCVSSRRIHNVSPNANASGNSKMGRAFARGLARHRNFHWHFTQDNHLRRAASPTRGSPDGDLLCKGFF